MTSDATKANTEEFFEKHNYFGLQKQNVKFFEQFTLPCLTFNGKVILADKHKLAVAPGMLIPRGLLLFLTPSALQKNICL